MEMAASGVKKTVAVAAIDFGTTCTGYAYLLKEDKPRPSLKNVNIEQAWEATAEVGLQAPTTVLMTPTREFDSFGFMAEEKYKNLAIKRSHADWYYFRYFKMKLHHEKELSRDMLLTETGGKKMKAMTIFTEAIGYVKKHLLQKIRNAVKDDISERNISWILTVPAIWRDSAKQFMREAAKEAGIPSELLALALEPEAAAIYCKELAVAKTQGVDGTFLKSFNPGEKYVVLDLGGGTVDTTVHEVLQDGKLRELHAATGGDWGGILVNEAFEEFIKELVGKTFFETLCKDEQSYWIGLQKTFESKKRQFSPSCDEDVTYLDFPSYIEDHFVEQKKSSLSKILDTKGYNDVVHKRGYLGLKAERMKKFFKVAVDKIIDHLQALLHESNLRGVGTILLVGGFSESPMVSDAVRSKFGKMSVIAPPSASIAILKGAVMYGVDRNIIASRVSPYSYGVHTRAVYKSKIHPATSKTTISKVTGKKSCHKCL